MEPRSPTYEDLKKFQTMDDSRHAGLPGVLSFEAGQVPS